MNNEPKRDAPSASQAAQQQQHHRRTLIRARIRGVIAILLFVLWFVVALTGFLLYLAPTGPRSGWVEILFLTKRGWGEVHFWLSVLAVIVTIIHLLVDWKAVKSAIHFLVSTRRGRFPHE